MARVESDGSACGADGRVRGRGPAAVLAEVALVALLFAAAGAWPTPDTNEAHYLTRARHGWNPAWLEGDFFLESREAHGVFSFLIGPLAAEWPLGSAAWAGRIAGWGALAAGFTFAASAAIPAPGWRLAAAALFSLAARSTTAAGEWVIGGCEAKVFAWGLVFAGIGWFARGRLAAAWITLGMASALHPLVGGWGMVALAVALAWSARSADAALPWPVPAARSILPLVVGLLLAAVGVVPALGLSAGVDAAGRDAAIATYVVERLPHHLLVRTFNEALVARHLLAIAVWWLLLPASTTAAQRRVAAFTVGALAISGAGLAVSLLESAAPALAHRLLRFYWFRLADGVLPAGLSIAAVAAISAAGGARMAAGRRRTALVALAAVLAFDLATESRHWPLPGRPAVASRADKGLQGAAWLEVCDWIRAHTPADACFLTPRGASSFHWHAERREVVCWKNIPQDAAGILEWRRRIVDCFSADGSLKNLVSSTPSLGRDRLAAAARKYGADHVVVPLNPLDPPPLDAEPIHVAGPYAVYRLAHPPDTP